MTPTEEYVDRLANLKSGQLALLRVHAGQGIDHTVDAFDLFAGLWWPLRARDQRTPRRAVAWLTAKLYAFRPIPNSTGETLARQIGCLRPPKNLDQGRPRAKLDRRFDSILTLPLRGIEPALRWALDLVASSGMRLDWVRLTNDLSIWERESTRLRWADEFLNSSKEKRHAD